jgi:hypothetical protein
MNKKLVTSLSFFLFLKAVCIENAYAYIDAGTGSYVIQMVIAACLGGIFTVKMFFKRIVSFITRRKPESKVEEN